jgi:type II secretory pathway pseudopilin PulG
MRKGFTLIELILVLGIMILVSAILFATLAGRRSDVDLTSTAQQAATLLRQAQSDAIAQKSDASWGVRFSNVTNTSSVPFYALFSGSYSTATVAGYYPLPSTVAYQTSTLASGATLDIIFSSISGAASVATNVGFYMPKQNTAFSSTISIASSGEISY